MVLGGGERDGVGAVAQREERRLLAGETFLDHHFGAGFPEIAGKHHVDGLQRLIDRCRNHHALAGGKSVGLDDDRSVLRADVVLGRACGGEARIGGGRNIVGAAQILGEALGAFELRRDPARPERLDAG